jgi:hypothetical protein
MGPEGLSKIKKSLHDADARATLISPKELEEGEVVPFVSISYNRKTFLSGVLNALRDNIAIDGEFPQPESNIPDSEILLTPIDNVAGDSEQNYGIVTFQDLHYPESQ